MIKRVLILLWDNLAIRNISTLFTHDAHNIVSKRGWIKLEEEDGK